MTVSSSWRFVPGYVWSGEVAVVVVVVVAGFLEESCHVGGVDHLKQEVIAENNGGLPIERSGGGKASSSLVLSL